MADPVLAARPSRLFDAHTHAWPEGLYAAVTRWFDRFGWPIHDRLSGHDAARKLRAEGVRRWVAMAYCHKPGMAAPLNAWLAEYAGRHPEATVLAAVHPHDDDAPGILSHALDDLGLRGLKIHCHVIGVAADDPKLDPLCEILVERDLPLVIHAGNAPAAEGYPVPTAEITGVGRFQRLLDRHPDLRCVLPHLGADEVDAAVELLDRFPGLMLDTAMTLTDWFTGGPSRDLVVACADRLMFGSDFPILPYPYDREWRAISRLGLGEAAERRIFHDNAEEFFR